MPCRINIETDETGKKAKRQVGPHIRHCKCENDNIGCSGVWFTAFCTRKVTAIRAIPRLAPSWPLSLRSFLPPHPLFTHKKKRHRALRPSPAACRHFLTTTMTPIQRQLSTTPQQRAGEGCQAHPAPEKGPAQILPDSLPTALALFTLPFDPAAFGCFCSFFSSCE